MNHSLTATKIFCKVFKCTSNNPPHNQCKICDEPFIPLSVIDNIQADAEQGCKRKLLKGWVCGEAELPTKNTMLGDTTHYCPSCSTIIATCKKIKGELK